MRINVLAVIATALLLAMGCDEKGPEKGIKKEPLISQGFVDDDTYRVVCRGYPLEGSTGVQMIESSKRAALLGAYYYIKNAFNESVAPDKDGKAEKFDYMGDHVVVHYMVQKKGLRKLTRAGN